MAQKKAYNPKELLQIIVKNLIFIVILGIIGGGAFFMYAKHKQRVTYTATRSLVVSHNMDIDNRNVNSQVNADLSMVPTYSDMIMGRQVTDNAYKRLPKKMRKEFSAQDMNSDISTDSKPRSLVITVMAKADKPDKAVKIVNNTAEAAKYELPKMQKGIGRVYLYPKANKKDVASETHTSVKKYTMIGTALGFLAGMVISFVVTTWRKLI